MAPIPAVRLLIAAVVAVGAVAVAGLFIGLRPVAATSAARVMATTSSPTPVTVPVTVNAVAASPNTVTVVGSGQVNAAPDQAVVSFSVSPTRPNARDALSAAGTEMTHLISALRGQGVADRDMQTSSVSLGQSFSCCPSVVTGYMGSGSLTVTIHHLANVGPIELSVVGAVPNDLQLSGISLTLSDPSSQLRAARIAAFADARSRADQWAAQTSRTLGPILAVSEIVNSQPTASSCTSGCGGAGGSGGVPVQAGLNAVSVNVTVQFQLK